MDAMSDQFLQEILGSRGHVLSVQEDGQTAYELAEFKGTSMEDDALWGTPFRRFETVPQGRESSRKQNDSLQFDPHTDTLFDYPMVVGALLDDVPHGLDFYNYHLTVQIPYCRMDCWHCYNDKKACRTGRTQETKVPHKPWTAQNILDEFSKAKKAAGTHSKEYNVLRVSGGEPFLVPELLAELLDAISDGSNPNYPQAIWTETNLTPWIKTEDGRSLFDCAKDEYFSRTKRDIEDMLRRNGDRLIVHPCFHGLSAKNITLAAGVDEAYGLTLEGLVAGFRRLHELGLNLYPTFLCEASDPECIPALFESLYRLVPFPVREFRGS